MASQILVAGKNTGGIPEVFREGIDGFIEPSKDSNHLALTISKIMAEKELATRMGHFGEAKVREKFPGIHVLI